MRALTAESLPGSQPLTSCICWEIRILRPFAVGTASTARHPRITHLIVQVVKQAAKGQQLVGLVRTQVGSSSLPCRRPQRTLHVHCRWRADEERCNGDKTEEVDAINVLRQWNTTSKQSMSGS
jgi:hypothetical protein